MTMRADMGRIPIPMRPPGASGGGPAPPASTDRFEAVYLIGNEPNGDPATAQAAPFRYLGDPGDGSAIVTAIAEATLTGNPTRIFVRPGSYIFDAANLPLSVPPNCVLEGSGEEVTALLGTDLSREVVQLDINAQLRHLTVALPNPTAGASGDRAVRLGAGAVADRVLVLVGDGTGVQDDDSLRACFDLQGLYARVFDCLVVYEPPMTTATDSPRVAYYGLGPRMSGPVVGDVYVRGRGRGAGELVFVASSVTSFALDLQGVCAAAGTINGSQGRGSLQATIQSGARPGALQLAGLGNLFDLSIYDGDGSSIDGYITCSSSRSTYRVSLEGAGVDGGVTDSGESNTWTGSLDANAAAVFAVDGEAIALDAMRISAPASGDIVFGATSLNCSAVGCRISGVTDDTAGGTGNNRALNLEGV